MEEEVRMSAIHQVLHEVLKQSAILFVTLLTTYILALLLDTPDGPKPSVGLFLFMDVNTDRFVVDEVAKRLFCSTHVGFKGFGFAD